MISPSSAEVLAATVTALEDVIAPSVANEHAASMLRTAVQLLRSVQVRLELEHPALAEDNADLRALLEQWRDRLPAATDLPAPAEARYPSHDGLVDEATCLRAALVAAIDTAPDAADPLRAAARAYLRRSLERQQPWLVDAFTGPRR